MTPPGTARRPFTSLTLLLGLLALAWPLAALVLLSRAGAWPLLVMLVALVWWRLPGGHKRWALVPALLALGVSLSGQAVLGVRAWPVLVNAGLLAVFAWSLRAPPSLVERLARRQDPDLPPQGVRYTRRVTQLWCGFFLVNGSLALWTALFAGLPTWTLYNGGIAYGLGAALFAGEWCVRQRVRRRQRSGPSLVINEAHHD